MKPPRILSWRGMALAFLLAAAFEPPARAADTGAQPDCGTADLLARKLPQHYGQFQGAAALVTDGQVVPDGAEWDAPAAISWDGHDGSLTYDLGKPTRVSALVVQADANDVYLLSGSIVDAPEGYRVIARADNVVDQGPGLRTRSMTIKPVTVRYLKIASSEGDGYYSISELAAFCQTPSPFPPRMLVGDAPMAAAPVPANRPPPMKMPKKPDSLLGPFERLLAVALLLLFGSGLFAARRMAPAGDGGTATTDPARVFPFLFVLFMLSGAAALIYEVVWFQMLQLVLGSSAVSIGVLLGTFMGGMCLGSLGLGRYVPRTRHPLRVYAMLELAIGVSGILMLVVMPLVEGVYTRVAGHGLLSLLWRGFFAALCLLPPTMLMGATLPAVARWVKTTPRGISWLGYLYAGNTVGAVLGCLTAGFYLLRVFNVSVATTLAVLLNVVGAAGAFALARRQPLTAADAGPEEGAYDVPSPSPVAARMVYLAIALSGVSALGAEVIWTRLFALLLGATTYTFSIILAVFLVGIGLGSSSASFLLRRSTNPLRALGIVQLLLIGAIAWAHWNITESIPFWPINPQIASGPWYQFQIDLVRGLWAILPAACLWGASFPLALAAASSVHDDGGRVVGRVYAANTLGAIVGALAMSLFIVSTFGTRNGERVLLVVSAVATLAAFLPLAQAGRKILFGAREVFWILLVVEATSIAVRNVAPVPPLLLGHGRLTPLEVHNKETFLYAGEGMNSSPVITRDPNGIISYHNAGKVQASSLPQDMRLQRMLGHLTTFLPEDPRSVLVIACGAGVTAGAASIDPRVQKETIAEIEPLVPEAAANYFGDYNFNVVRNPKVHVEIDDARHFLNTTKEKFDAITSDPFDPWVKGAANLYTKEFWEMVRAHLNPGGVATVFVQLYLSGVAASKSEIATFFQAFPHAVIWGNPVRGVGYDIVLMGRADDRPINVDHIQQLLERPDFAQVARSLRQIGFNSAIDLLATFAGRDPELGPWLADAEINRDNNLRLQFLAGFDLNLDQREQTYREMISYRQYPANLFTGAPATLEKLRDAILHK